MKFSHSLQFNAVPDWKEYYISYNNLKKLIYRLEQEVNHSRGGGNGELDLEASPLLIESAGGEPDVVFRASLDSELEKVISFYQDKESQVNTEVNSILEEIDTYLQFHPHAQLPLSAPSFAHGSRGSVSRGRRASQPGTPTGSSVSPFSGADGAATGDVEEDTDDEDDDDQGQLLGRGRSTSVHQRGAIHRRQTTDLGTTGRSTPVRPRRASLAIDVRDGNIHADAELLQLRLSEVFVTLSELISYIQLNRTGFRKVLKKYDKTLDRNMKDEYLASRVGSAYPFQDSTSEKLKVERAEVETAYARLATHGDLELAKEKLRIKLREHVTWERNTVWRDMIGIERRTQAALLGSEADPIKSRLQGDEVEPAARTFRTPLGRISVPRWIANSTFFSLMASWFVFFLMLWMPLLEPPEQQNCLAMVVLVSLLWATEAIPLFVTSLLVPLLCVVLRIVRDDAEPHNRLGAKDAAKYVIASMWTPVIMLLLGGFTIAAALSKYNIAKLMATFVLSKAGTKPETVLLVSMFVAAFTSMWISNVAAPVLCYSIVQPILRNLPSGSKMSKALVLGIALASNVGGMGSPIASPQNLIALQNMDPAPGWGVWFFIALPVSIFSILATWFLLVLTFRPGRNTTIMPIRPMRDRFSGTQWFVSIVTLMTIVMWIFSHQVEAVFGDMGVIALFPIVVFFGSGILTKEDFNNFLWTIIILAAGGLALGKAVNSSGLLLTLASTITSGVQKMPLYSITAVLSGIILVIATFISHTVAALIFLPLVQQVGLAMKDPHPNLLVMAGVLMCSTAMGLPTSGFPNMTAIMKEDERTGQRYLRVRHFITRGIPASILSYVIMMTIGYLLMVVAGF